MPINKEVYPCIYQGQIIGVSNSYVVVKTDETKLILYTDELVPYDTKIAFTGYIDKIEHHYSSYGFDFGEYANNQGIFYSVNKPSIEILSETNSLRGKLFEIIDNIQNQTLRNCLLKTFFNINNDEFDLMSSVGFTFSGFFILLRRILKYIFEEDKVKKIMVVSSVIMFVLFRGTFITFRIMLGQILSLTSIDRKNKISLYGVLLLLYDYHKITSMGFWLPFLFRAIGYNRTHQKLKGLCAASVVQSLFINTCNPIMTLLYPFMMMMLGITPITGLFDLIFHSQITITIYQVIDTLSKLLSNFVIRGNCLGFGLIIYFLIIFSIKASKYKLYLTIIIYLVFMFTGMFHPLGEVTFINVGQGDAILIRLPFNQANVLVDTGKPSQYQYLQSYLYAKGIYHIDALIVTHQDDDHSGNVENIQNDFEVVKTYTTHQKMIQIKDLVIYDLNEVEGQEEENDNSLTQLFQFNGLTYLMMGDASISIEDNIIQQYKDLNVDVLKLGHHGSKTSSSFNFLSTVRARLGIISAGVNNMYGHPSPETIQHLLQAHLPYINTATQGDISIMALNHLNLVTTVNKIIAII